MDKGKHPLWTHVIENLHWQNTMRILGATGFLHELLIGSGVERPFILALSGTLMGLPSVLKLDKDRREGGT